MKTIKTTKVTKGHKNNITNINRIISIFIESTRISQNIIFMLSLVYFVFFVVKKY